MDTTRSRHFRNSRSAALAIALAAAACSNAAEMSESEDPSEDVDSCGSVASALSATASREILPSPGVGLSDAELAQFVVLPEPVPSLLFHGICETTCATGDVYGMTRAELERTMLMLNAAGYTTISSAEYARYMRSDWANLPARPIYVTFDDSRLDSYRGADDILRTTGTKATMFAITGRAEAKDPVHMSWAELAAAQASGRWDIQLHGHESHSRIDIGGGVMKPYVANRLPGESFEQWKARAEGDILKGLALLKAKVPGFVQLTYALPFGDYGQNETNDPAIPVELRAWLGLRFVAWFTQPSGQPDFTLINQPTKERPRYTIRNTTRAEDVYAYLINRQKRRARTPSL